MNFCTKAQSDKIKWNIEKNWLASAPGSPRKIPEDLRVLHMCECGEKYGFVWGKENEEGQTRYLKNESGTDIKKCGACMIKDEKDLEQQIMKHNIRRLREAEERLKSEREARTKSVKYKDVDL